MFRFSQTRASPSQTHALWTFDQHSATCARSVLPAGSAAHNSVLGCVYGKARSAAHTGVLKQLGSCNRKLSAVPASTRSGRCFQSQKQRNCSSPGKVHKLLRLPRNLHMDVHKVLRLPRNLDMEVHKVLCLLRNLHFKKQVKTLIPMEGRFRPCPTMIQA